MTPAPARGAATGVALDPADALALGPGTWIAQYERIRELGRGAMGVVFAARDTKLGRRVEIEFVLDATAEIAERFIVEARATAQCNHDNIVIREVPLTGVVGPSGAGTSSFVRAGIGPALKATGERPS
jgi:serine/threonine protein kinase